MDKILVAIDTTDISYAKHIITQTMESVGGFKFGLEYFNRHGAEGIISVLNTAHTPNVPVFLDLKFHDIPNTVAGAVRGIFDAGVSPHILNVHIAGGINMMQSAKQQALESADKQGGIWPLVIGVTVLTSLNDTDLSAIGVTTTSGDQAVKMAELAKTAGLDGVVCSAHEIARIKSVCGADFKTIVPGIRPKWAASNDQKRIMTPAEALRQGADYLVIGRPITESDNIQQSAQRIATELNS